MRSLEERFAAVITELEQLGAQPVVRVVDDLGRRVDQLDYELQTDAALGDRRYELTMLSRRAEMLFLAARDRAEQALDIDGEAARR